MGREVMAYPSWLELSTGLWIIGPIEQVIDLSLLFLLIEYSRICQRIYFLGAFVFPAAGFLLGGGAPGCW
jgi:hypothetical protein